MVELGSGAEREINNPNFKPVEFDGLRNETEIE